MEQRSKKDNAILDPKRQLISDEASKRKHHRNRDLKDVNKFIVPFHERSSSCKLRLLNSTLLIIICGAFLMYIFSPVSNNEHSPMSPSRSRFLDIGWLWEKPVFDSRYLSDLNVNWTQISTSVAKLNARKRNIKVGLLNFNITEINFWQQLLNRAELLVLHLEAVKANLTWEDLYPEWIDEEDSEVPTCPDLPDPTVPRNARFDLIAVKLPFWCWPVPGPRAFVTNCFPMPNLFSCKDLVMHEGHSWLYNPNPGVLQDKISLPVGSCKLAVPLETNVRPYLPGNGRRREAYATILHSAHIYVCGAIAAAQSIRLVGSTRELVILVDETITSHHRNGLAAAGWEVRTIQRIRNPKAERDAYNEWNYSKFRLWQLTDYDKIIFIDADLLILRNIDFLFSMPEISATGNNATLFNSGVMVLEPSNCTFQMLMEHINEIESYNGGDQGYLNEIFTWWHRIPKHMNFLKHFWVGDDEEIKQKKVFLFGANPPVLYVLHYLGLKPWLCFKDYDCNWNVDILQEFASDVAHATWWRVHDAMPENLQSYCLLRSKQKAALEWDRRQAEKANYPDAHWRRNITDPRLHICFEEFCFWESMLWHWGETNWTNNGSPSSNVTKTVALSNL
ncbi:hypothetical protein HPP92_011043 [Vanilla planifolia]|uniref:Hexosyltransferase n=1 Tax=Vanilla planifolia TaxID=51239 RepID=A0A835R233_VANPL|nr:hypothetical protein HPP92_011043 [Vanilla planifolia]